MFIYTTEAAGLKRLPLAAELSVPQNAVWLDMYQFTSAEEAQAEAFLDLPIPTREEMNEIELSSSLYHEGGAVYMTFNIVGNADTPEPDIQPCTCILAGGRLVTVRYSDPKPFRQFIAKIEKLPASEHSGPVFFVLLLESVIERLADILERVGGNIDQMTRLIFRSPAKAGCEKPNYQEILERMGREGDLASKARESLVTLDRIMSYALQSKAAGIRDDSRTRLETLLHDVTALGDHIGFLSNKINFLLDATLGMINIEQNAIIKIFSVASVVFLPPTLIASIYGMNFEHMPELKWHLGYPLALLLMTLSSLFPYLYFKRRKWL